MNFKNGKTLRDEPSRIRLLAMRESVQSFINLLTCIVRASYFLFFSFGIIRSRFGIKPASSANSSAISAAISPGLISGFSEFVAMNSNYFHQFCFRLFPYLKTPFR